MWSPRRERTVALLLAPAHALVICGQLTPIELSWDAHRTTAVPRNDRDEWGIAALRSDLNMRCGMAVLLTAKYASAASAMLDATEARAWLDEVYALRSEPYIRLPIAPRAKSDHGPIYIDERATMNALVSLLTDRPDLRLRLADTARTTQLAADITNGMLSPTDTIILRRRTRTILAAMGAAGLVHPYDRPMPGDAIPSLDASVAAVRSKLVPDDHGRTDDEHIVDSLRKYYIDVSPWPFHALLA
ncbi:MAG: hypothetical protein ABIR68_11165 [Ilumatobacteraceae bacterium]